MKDFRKYNSIENSYREEFLQQLIENGFDKGEFVVQEKVHGANLSFWTDGNSIQTAKRTEFLAEDDNFYNYIQVRNKYSAAIKAAFVSLKLQYPDAEYIAIFGELFGGSFPHPDVDRDKASVNIQKGIYYSPSNEFYAFDVLVNNEVYLSVDEANTLFEQHNFFYAKTLFRGTFEQAMEYPNSFESKISEWLGLPSIEDNICEGVVIKPVEAKFFNNGSRVMLKNKNEKWEENIRRKRVTVEQEKISDAAQTLSEIISEYVTVNRLNNVISKIGDVGAGDFGKVIGLLSKDALEDFTKDYRSEIDQLEKKEQKIVRKALNRKASQLVREKFPIGEN